MRLFSNAIFHHLYLIMWKLPNGLILMDYNILATIISAVIFLKILSIFLADVRTQFHISQRFQIHSLKQLSFSVLLAKLAPKMSGKRVIVLLKVWPSTLYIFTLEILT